MASNPCESATCGPKQFGLFLARFCTSAWVGAASLFVVVGVAEVTGSGFDSMTKDLLVSVRFPAYYVCGSVLVGTAWLGTWFAGSSPFFPVLRHRASLTLLGLTLILMAVDYLWIFQPLLQMVSPPGQAKSANFISYHACSKWINLAGLVCCLVVAGLVNWPVSVSVTDFEIRKP